MKKCMVYYYPIPKTKYLWHRLSFFPDGRVVLQKIRAKNLDDREVIKTWYLI